MKHIMNEEDKEAKKLVQDIFEHTNIKASEDDPSIALVLGIRNILKNNIQDFEEQITYLNHQQLINIQSELAHAVTRIKMELDGANEYYVDNSINHEKNLAEAFEKLLNDFEAKNKDLNFILNKIQAEYDKASDERFERHIAKLEALQAEALKRQKKMDTSKQREVLFSGIGFFAGVLVCLLIFFIVR